MLLEDFWRKRGFATVSFETYLWRSAVIVVGTVLVFLLCAAVRSVAPFGFWALALTEYQRRKGSVWWIANATVERADHPRVFGRSIAKGYVGSLLLIAYGLYQIWLRAGAV